MWSKYQPKQPMFQTNFLLLNLSSKMKLISSPDRWIRPNHAVILFMLGRIGKNFPMLQGLQKQNMRKHNTLVFSMVPKLDSRETRTRSEYRSKNSPHKIFLFLLRENCFHSFIFSTRFSPQLGPTQVLRRSEGTFRTV